MTDGTWKSDSQERQLNTLTGRCKDHESMASENYVVVASHDSCQWPSAVNSQENWSRTLDDSAGEASAYSMDISVT